MATGQENRESQMSGKTQGATGGQTTPEWDALKGEVGDMAETAMDQGRELLDSARNQATGYVDQRKNDAAESVAGLANTLRESAGSFGDSPSIQAVADNAAKRLEQLAGNIRERSLTDILDDVETMVRQRPAIAAAVTLTAGFLLARFVKASADAAGRTGSQGRGSSSTGQWTSGPSASSGSGAAAGRTGA
jgi:ElaB/YqjD/DUF883 family membrane-anchored ribosome-binding protein